MLVNDYWLLTFDNGDFILVEQPSLKMAQLIKTYHQLLLSVTRSLVSPEAIAHQDFYFGREIYYKKIADLLTPTFDCSQISLQSRDSFFIFHEKRGDNWISGLELLLGLDYVTGEDNQTTPQIQVTSGNLEIDIVAELLLYIESGRIDWLVQNKSPQYLIKLIKQMSDRRRGQEAIDEIQRQKDLELLNKNPDIEKQLENSGFKF